MEKKDSIWKEHDSVSGEEVKRRKTENIYIEEISNGNHLENLVQQNSPVNNALIRDSKINDLYCDWSIAAPELNEVKVREKKGRMTPVYTLCSFTYDESIDFEKINKRGMFNITAYDRRVYNAIGTLWLSGRRTFSLTEIVDVMNGYRKTKPSAKQLQSVEKALHKLKNVNLHIDLTAEVKAHMLKDKQPLIDAGILKDSKDDVKSVVIEDSMLHYRMMTITSKNGKQFKTIQIMSEPSLLTYNRAKGTLLTIPMEYIRLSSTNATEKVLAFQDYLLMRIINYQNGYMNESKVLYDTLYKDSGIEKPSVAKDFKRDRDIIKKMLDEWKNQELIEGYSDIKKGRSYIGFKFQVKEAEESEL